MVTIEENEDDSSVGSRQFHPGAGTQDAASALMSFGFGAASGERQLTPQQKQIINQSQKEIQLRLNRNGENQSTSSDEEDEMIDLMSGWNEGEQQARQQVNSPMRIKTTTATSRRVTMSTQKRVVTNPYLKSFTTNRRNTAPGSLAILVDGKENPAATVVSKKTVTRTATTPNSRISLVFDWRQGCVSRIQNETKY